MPQAHPVTIKATMISLMAEKIGSEKSNKDIFHCSRSRKQKPARNAVTTRKAWDGAAGRFSIDKRGDAELTSGGGHNGHGGVNKVRLAVAFVPCAQQSGFAGRKLIGAGKRAMHNLVGVAPRVGGGNERGFI